MSEQNEEDEDVVTNDLNLCCGKSRTSAFCPDCGKQMQQVNPLHELRLHCFMSRKKIISTRDRYEVTLVESQIDPVEREAHANGIRHLEKELTKNEKAILKWTRWIDALDAILVTQEKKDE